MSTFRKLKIYSKFRIRSWDTISVPEIRLQGKWLAALGFTEGKEIKVVQKKNKLVITVLKEKTDSGTNKN
ncbi:type I addiction module toxin, SymE family [Leptobacterium flavescens]|uniref:Type I addiction module toxin, SymE family n=1 Tax=Leptobacterium flavescens TaxID=472055 RepID=A0A6P0UT07_9FLAO|nr:SymE family type I addiction module toxin [Leptobacterium flavescens]NER15118.1 type I addiction module toxin, SymE family [Leptobacterium flavescens]